MIALRVLPWAIAWITVLMSAKIYDGLSSNTGADPAQLFFIFLGVPVIAFASVLSAREAERRTATTLGAGSLLVLSWMIFFLAVLHGFVLALASGRITSIATALPLAIAGLFLGLGPLAARLEPKSPMGIRTRATLADPQLWRRAHRVLGTAFAASGALGLAATWASGELPVRMIASVVPGFFGLFAAILYGTRKN